MPELQAWDTDFYPSTPAVTASTTIVQNIAALTAVDGTNYYMSTWPLLLEAFTISLHSVSFDSTNANYDSIGAIQVPNYYKYPQVDQKCYMYEVIRTYQDVDASNNPNLFFEVKLSEPLKTITPKDISTVTNCQDRAQSMRVLDVRNPASATSSFPWITFDS